MFFLHQVTNLTGDCQELKGNLDRVKVLADEQNKILEGIWEEEQRRIVADSKSFRDQLSELSSMQDDVSRILCLSDHLARFVSSGSVGLDGGGRGGGDGGGGGGGGGTGGRSRSREEGGKRRNGQRRSSSGRRNGGNGDNEEGEGKYSSKTLPAKRSQDQASVSAGGSQLTLPRYRINRLITCLRTFFHHAHNIFLLPSRPNQNGRHHRRQHHRSSAGAMLESETAAATAPPPLFSSPTSYPVEVHRHQSGATPPPHPPHLHHQRGGAMSRGLLEAKGMLAQYEDDDGREGGGGGGGADSRLSFCSDDLPIRDSSSQMDLPPPPHHEQGQLPSSVPSPIDQVINKHLFRKEQKRTSFPFRNASRRSFATQRCSTWTTAITVTDLERRRARRSTGGRQRRRSSSRQYWTRQHSSNSSSSSSSRKR